MPISIHRSTGAKVTFWKHWEWPVLGAVTLIAAVLRLYRLDVLPPGVHFDEAVYGLQAQTIYRGSFPVFFPGYTGREPLYMYLVALVYLFTKPGTFGLRLTSALIGIATVPAAYFAVRELLGRRVAMLTAFLTATAFWHLNVTRTGFCWTLMPLMESITIYLLWRGYQEGRHWLLVLGGMGVAANLYIYLAARFFPFALLCILVYLLIVDRRRLRARRLGLALAVLAALVSFAPLGLHFLRVPHDFWERADQVLSFKRAGMGSSLRLLADNALHIIPTFLPRLDTTGRYSLQGRAAFDPLIGPFFLLGLGLALWRWRRPQYGVLALWWFVMALPPIFTVEPYPVSQRIFGTIPAVYALAAVGMDGIWRWAEPRNLWRKAVPAGLGAILVAEAVWAGLYYFTVWASSRETYRQFHSDMAELGRDIRPEMGAGHRIVIASEHWHHPSVIIDQPAAVDCKWAQGKRLVALPAWDGREIDYFVPVLDAPLIEPARQVLQQAACAEETFANNLGDTVVEMYRICRPPQAARPAAPLAVFAGEVQLWSVDVPAEGRRGDALRVGLQWEVLRGTDEPRGFAVHLVDSQGICWAQADELGYIPAEWQPGDQVWQWLDVPLPESVPPGTYQVRVILDGENAAPLPVRDGQGALLGTYFAGGHVSLLPDPHWVEAPLAQAPSLGPLQVRAWTPIRQDRRPGERLQAEVDWQLAGQVQGPLTAELSLRTADGLAPVQWHYPLATEYPVDQWQAGEVVRQRYLLTLPPDTPEGDYTLSLSVQGRAESVSLGTVHVAGLARLLEPPPMEHPFSEPFTLGTGVRLLGYDLEPKNPEPSEPVRLTLYWQALAAMDRNEVVFVHLLNENGDIVAQRDIAPADGKRPTTGWVAGEVVLDLHSLSPNPQWAPGTYHLAIGMYDPETLVRLEMRTAAGERVPDDRLIVDSVEVSD